VRPPWRRVRHWQLWFIVLALVAATMWYVRGDLDKAHVALAFLLVVLGGSAAGGRALGISLSIVAFLVFNWVFLPPYNTFVIANPLDWLVLIAFLVTGIVAAQLLEWRRREAEVAQQRAEEIDQLATLGAETLKAARATEALDAIAAVIRSQLGVDECAIFVQRDDAGLMPGGRSPGTASAEGSGLLEYIVANAESAAERADGTLAVLGGGVRGALEGEAESGALENLRALGIPLTVRTRVVGALRLSSRTPFTLTHDQRRVLSALSYYAALGVERVRLTGAEEEAESLRRADRLKDALLASVSHDLRTPLTAIKGIANEIWTGGDPERAQIIEEEADRLNTLVDDLLELSQINAGGMRVTRVLNTVDDVVGAALERVEAALGQQRVDVRIENEGGILVGEFDFAHTMRALTNLLENALKYSPASSRVILRVHRDHGELRFQVDDSGPGVANGEQDRIFEPFFRGSGTSDRARGTGLGLSIARQLAELQGGSVRYEPRAEGGSRFTLGLPG
jgi:two-component system, OmpR family, sensor histidine kinase KdpD